jgi:hypothetical protein
VISAGDDENEIGTSTRLWATDFNADGWLDLLIGGKIELPVSPPTRVQPQSIGGVWILIRKPPE